MEKPSMPSEFKLERYFAKYEFTTKYLLCCSDAEAVTMKELLSMADDECKELWDNLSLCYTESPGHPLLREEVANIYKSLSSDEVLIITPQEGIYIAMNVISDFLRRKHQGNIFHAVATFPAYQSLYENLKTSGVDLSYWNVQDRPGGWEFDIAHLKKLIRDDTKFLVVNFPHNPSGFIPSEDQWQEIIQICRSRDIILFSDEMYRLTDNHGLPPLPSAVDCYEKAITLSGLSKSFALPGLRIGWLACKMPDLMREFASFKDYLTICSSAPSEILSIIALRNWQKLIDRTLNVIQPNLSLMDDFASRHSDVIEWHRPKACTTGLMKIKGWLLKFGKGGASGFCDKLVKECSVLLLPAAMYDFKDEYVRLGFGRRNFPEALKAFEDFLDQNKPK